jgi:hypothetical protein
MSIYKIMREQPHWTNVLTADFFTEHYVKERMSYPKLKELLNSQGHNVHIGTIHKYAKRLGFGRNISEGKRNIDTNPLDYNASFIHGQIIEAIDGFLLGDGNISPNDTDLVKSGRLQCGVQYREFCEYLMKPFIIYQASVHEYPDSNMSSGIKLCGRSKFHPDIYKQYQRWYPNDGKKQPPNDVRITPTSVMMWYLGDGSLVTSEKTNTVTVRLSTDGFDPERVEFLAKKLCDIGIACHRNNDNRILIEARGVPSFFDYIGRKSPVECYSYKFDLPTWRFEAKRMREVADELGVDYHKLSYLVKIGKIPCFRASENGRPRFLPEHISYIKENIC